MQEVNQNDFDGFLGVLPDVFAHKVVSNKKEYIEVPKGA
jgi:hypothetical protein